LRLGHGQPFGEAEVIADPFGGEPRFDLRYHQI